MSVFSILLPPFLPMVTVNIESLKIQGEFIRVQKKKYHSSIVIVTTGL